MIKPGTKIKVNENVAGFSIPVGTEGVVTQNPSHYMSGIDIDFGESLSNFGNPLYVWPMWEYEFDVIE